MGQLVFRAGIFFSIMMFGFILGILYSDQGIDFNSERFDIKIVEEEESNNNIFELKEEETNIIDIEDDDGVVIYQDGGDEEIHKFLEDDDSLFNKSNSAQSELSPLFSELGLRTAAAFEKVFKKMFSVVNG